jgi:hypothetical protein
MVGTRRLELLTSTVANFQVAVLPTTYRSLVTAEQRGNTWKPNFLQVILQARFCTGITRPDTVAVLVIRFTAQLSCRELGSGSPPSRSPNRQLSIVGRYCVPAVPRGHRSSPGRSRNPFLANNDGHGDPASDPKVDVIGEFMSPSHPRIPVRENRWTKRLFPPPIRRRSNFRPTRHPCGIPA